MQKSQRFELWLCGRQTLTTLAKDDHDDVAHAVEAAREYMERDAMLLKVEVHSGAAHVCTIGRGWMSKSTEHFAAASSGSQLS